MNEERTGFHKFEDLPETDAERELKLYHDQHRKNQEAEAALEDGAVAPKQRRARAAKPAKWEQGANDAQEGTLQLTQLALAEIYKNAIEKNLEKFKNAYNKKHPSNKISLALTLNKRIFDEPNANNIVAQASVAVEIRENGVGRIMVTKIYNFTHKRQIMDEGEWKLTLYKEILYELIGAGVTLAILTNPENNILYGDKKQDEAG